MFINFPINTHHNHCTLHYIHDMFRPVVAAIIVHCYSYTTRKNWGSGLSFTWNTSL